MYWYLKKKEKDRKVTFFCLLKPTCIRLSVIGQLKTLTNLDGVLIADEEAAEALYYIEASVINQV